MPFDAGSATPRRQRWLILIGALLALGLAWIGGATVFVQRAARDRTYSDMTAIPPRHVGLVLGCSKLLGDGRPNAFFNNRIQAAARLLLARKVDYLIVSGDNHVNGYDEPGDMKAALIEAGARPERIYCDYAGFRTLDSIVRVKEIFGQTSFTVVSQEFHNQRAIFIAQHRVWTPSASTPRTWMPTIASRRRLVKSSRAPT